MSETVTEAHGAGPPGNSLNVTTSVKLIVQLVAAAAETKTDDTAKNAVAREKVLFILLRSIQSMECQNT